MQIKLQTKIPDSLNNYRLDKALSQLFPEHSRVRLQSWIKSGAVTVDGKVLSQSDKIFAGQEVVIVAEIKEQGSWQAQKIKNLRLDIVYEDKDLIIVNKPAGLTTHPGAGNPDQTLVNALLYQYPELKLVPRSGVIHRIDKDTSGLLVIARTPSAHTKLVAAMKKHVIKREYVAIVSGALTGGGTINAPIGRHPLKRKTMAVLDEGKVAITHYRLLERFKTHTFIKVILETGRTHQIRVHMTHLGYPLVGDKVYGNRTRIPAGMSEEVKKAVLNFPRQALHAQQLSLPHPRTGKNCQWQAPLPRDLEKLLKTLRDNELASKIN